jgi:hypothetical protein
MIITSKKHIAGHRAREYFQVPFFSHTHMEHKQIKNM